MGYGAQQVILNGMVCSAVVRLCEKIQYVWCNILWKEEVGIGKVERLRLILTLIGRSLSERSVVLVLSSLVLFLSCPPRVFTEVRAAC